MYSKILKKTIIEKNNHFCTAGYKIRCKYKYLGGKIHTIMANAIALLNNQDISKGLNILYIYIYNLI